MTPRLRLAMDKAREVNLNKDAVTNAANNSLSDLTAPGGEVSWQFYSAQHGRRLENTPPGSTSAS